VLCDIPIRGNPVDVDTDRTVSDGSDLTVGVDTTGGGFVSTNTDTSRSEMPRVRVGLETNEVGSQDTLKDFLSL
jgi:hypothetical protein